MSREPAFDLIYMHEALAAYHEIAPLPPTPTSVRVRAAADLNARLRCLKALMDAERDQRLGPCDLTLRARRKTREAGKLPHRTRHTLN